MFSTAWEQKPQTSIATNHADFWGVFVDFCGPLLTELIELDLTYKVDL